MFVFTSIMIGFDVADRRGVVITALAQFVYATILVGSVLPPLIERVRDDALLGGGLFGPLAAVLLIDFTPLSLWLCAVLGVVAGIVGIAVKVWWQRDRWRRYESDEGA